MENFSLYGVSGSIILDTRKQKKNKLYPIKYRFTFQRERFYISSGIDLTEADWEILDTTKKRNLIEIRTQLSEGFERNTSAVKEVFRKENSFSFESFDRELNKGRTSDLFKLFEKKISDLNNEGRIGSAIAYRCSLNSLKKFTKKEELKLSEVSVDFLKKYETWMLEEKNSFTTIGIYIRQLRAIYNEAKKDFSISDSIYPFGRGKYEIPTGESVKKALSIEQIKKIYDFPLKPGSRADLYRDIWFFSYLCNGMNMYDVCLLKPSNINDNEIAFLRHKTIRTAKKKKLIRVPVLPEVQEIIDKWGNKDKDNDDYIFPFLKKKGNKKVDNVYIKEKKDVQSITKYVNTRMKKIGNAVGIGDITTYTARHTFATVLKRSGLSTAFIGDSLGHADIKVTEHYLDSFEKDARMINAQKLIQYK